jgi:hypothetical protein
MKCLVDDTSGQSNPRLHIVERSLWETVTSLATATDIGLLAWVFTLDASIYDGLVY